MGKIYTNFNMNGPISQHIHYFPRLVLLIIFIYHGLNKFPSPQGLAQMLQVSPFLIYLLGIIEIIAGVFIFIGPFTHAAFTHLGSFIIVVVMIGAIFTVHWGQWLDQGGAEFPLVILSIAAYFLFKGNET